MDVISFNPAMLAALLAGHKTVTRRRLAPALSVQQDPGRYHFRGLTVSGALFEDRQEPGKMLPPVACPFGQPSMVLRVQEAPVCLLRVVSIRVEQVCSISETQARLEGIRYRQQQGRKQWGGIEPDSNSGGYRWYDNAVGAFQALLNSIYPAAWACNEWVWVVEFVRLP